MPAFLKFERCDGCGTCLEVCPREGICLENGKAVFHQEFCIDCHFCEDICPKKAIKIEWPVSREVVSCS